VEVVIPPETCVSVPVLANFPEKSDSLYIEKIFNSNRNLEDIYTAPDSLIKRERPILQVSNFSSATITIQVGQTLGKARNPDNWLDRPSKYSGESLQRAEAHVQLIRRLHLTELLTLNLGFRYPSALPLLQAKLPPPFNRFQLILLRKILLLKPLWKEDLRYTK